VKSKAKMPKAIVVSVIALSINMLFVFFYIGLSFLNKQMPNISQVIWFALDVYVLLGIFNEYRQAWIAGLLVVCVNVNGLVFATSLFYDNKILPAFLAFIGFVIPGIVLFFTFMRNSVRNYFQLNCPKCGKSGSMQNWVFSKCSKCDLVW